MTNLNSADHGPVLASATTRNPARPALWAMQFATGLALALALSATGAQAETQLRTGTLVCQGDGGWGAIITSKKAFSCTFASTDGTVRET